MAENLLARQFQVGTPDRAWLADLTYVATAEGWLYLAAALDLGTRRVVGWSMDTTMARSLVIDALTLAIRQRRPAAGLIHHSDRGSQYASHDYQRLHSALGYRTPRSVRTWPKPWSRLSTKSGQDHSPAARVGAHFLHGTSPRDLVRAQSARL